MVVVGRCVFGDVSVDGQSGAAVAASELKKRVADEGESRIGGESQ